MYNRGTRYLEKGNYQKALQCFKKQAVTHSFKELWLNMGNSYRGLMKPDKALEMYKLANDSAIPFASGAFAENYALALNNIGLLAYACGDDETAIDHYKAALTLDPMHFDAIWNYSSALLRSTNCSSDTGWKAYEYRFKRSGKAVPLDLTKIVWDGISSGRGICVQTEQGIGDKIMFGRYLQRLTEYFEFIDVVCHPSLDVFYSDYNVVRSVAESTANVTIGICSLAQWFFGTVDEKWLEGKFTARKFDAKKLNVGVVWSGSTTHANNHNRSCPSYLFSGLASSAIKLYGINPADAKAKNVEDISSKDWSSTAEAVLGLDCVVSVDTAIVHLCGTLGVPCIMIQPTWETDFRWGKEGDKNVWYESVDVIYNHGWEKSIAKVSKLLAERKKLLTVRLMTGYTEDEWAKAIKEQECIEK
jgi:tetratricopeptide (TPR) repeat protein